MGYSACAGIKVTGRFWGTDALRRVANSLRSLYRITESQAHLVGNLPLINSAQRRSPPRVETFSRCGGGLGSFAQALRTSCESCRSARCFGARRPRVVPTAGLSGIEAQNWHPPNRVRRATPGDGADSAPHSHAPTTRPATLRARTAVVGTLDPSVPTKRRNRGTISTP